MATPTEKQLTSSLDWAIRLLERQKREIPEMLRKRQHEVTDGYPASSGGGSGGSNGPSDPTAQAAINKRQSDPTGITIDNWIQNIGEVKDLADRLEGGRMLVANAGESGLMKEQHIGKQCLCCGKTVYGVKKDDRLRRGYCDACRKAWDRYARNNPDPSPVIFQANRIKENAFEESEKAAVN